MYPMACSAESKLHILQPILEGLSGDTDGIPDANGGEVVFFDKSVGCGKTDIEDGCNVGHSVSPTFLLRVFLFVTHKLTSHNLHKRQLSQCHFAVRKRPARLIRANSLLRSC